MNTSAPPSLPSGLYGVCDDTVRPELPVPEQAKAWLDGGARVLQLRFKRTSTSEVLRQVRETLCLTRAANALCLVNDRVDWALATGADGVHVGDEDLPCADARKLLGRQGIVGVTVRNFIQAAQAKADGATYVGFGPVFATSTKSVPAPVLGLERLAREVAAMWLPVIAIGGITLERMASVAHAGVHGAAVVSDVLLHAQPAERARHLQQAFNAARSKG